MSDAAKPLPTVCRLLKTKAAYGSEHGNEWQRGESNTDCYWCLNTMEAFGPDDGFAHPHECMQGRACFQVPADQEDDLIA